MEHKADPLEPKSDLLRQSFAACKQAFFYVFLFSLFINILMLTVALYTLQIFDRVFASHSYDTLIYLTLIAAFGIGIMSALDYIRSRILLYISHWLDARTSPEALYRSVDILLQGQSYPQQSLKDIAEIRNFLSGPGIIALMDAPWVPIYIIVIFFLHPLLGVISVVSACLLFIMAFLSERSIRKMSDDMGQRIIREQSQLASTLRNAESIQAMGMLPAVINRWYKENQNVLHQQDLINKRTGIFVAYSKFLRLASQIAILGIGAYLVIQNRITSGSMIAGSIIMSRALAPIEQIITLWSQMLKARQAYGRLDAYFSMPKPRMGETKLPRPTGALVVEGVSLLAPLSKTYILKGLSFRVNPGEILAIIGPSAAGKTSLARLLVGVWPPTAGSVRLDGAEVYTWERSDIGQYIGYLPQNVDLFQASVKENISRLNIEASDESIIQAGKDSHSHDKILALSHGYDTVISESAQNISSGQRQRIALARAFYGDPVILVLDEPSLNLDIEGEIALTAAILEAKKKGKTIVMISHHLGLVKQADRILYLLEGQILMLGPTNDVLAKMQSLQTQTENTQDKNKPE